MNKRLSLMIVTLVLCLSTSAANAENAKRKKFDKKHPRRAEVLGRANNEEAKNNAAAVNGKITDKQAQKLDREDQHIKGQEERQAARNGGHITKAEQARDNREENAVNAQRAGMEKRDAAAGGAPAAPAAPAGN